MTKLSVLVFALGLAACGGNKGGGTTTPAADPADCGNVATKIVTVMGAEAGVTDEAGKKKVHDALSGTCLTGTWSPEARTCFVTAADGTAMQACADKLDDMQKKDMVEAIGKAADGATEPAPAAP